MENKHKVLPAETMMEHVEALIAENCTVSLVVSGNSMSPFLAHGRDTVYLSPVTDELKRGDIILYRRENGAYLLHRICKVCESTYSLIGDAQSVIEDGIRPEQVIAVVTAVYRKGKLVSHDSFIWKFYEKLWIRMINVRPLLMRTYARIAGKR